MFRTAVFFGGTGFIGVHLADFFLEAKFTDHVILADIEPISEKKSEHREKLLRKWKHQITFKYCDVRQQINTEYFPNSIDFVVNLAAVHREPGHDPAEYYDTNVNGANSICEFARLARVQFLINFSSIAVYGGSSTQCDEKTQPSPVSDYGKSKCQAEKVFESLVMDGVSVLNVRPGVVFGASEFGNVTRLCRLVEKRLFVYFGNREVHKAGIYILELCNLVYFFSKMLQQTEPPKFFVVNGCYTPTPTLDRYVKAINQTLNRHKGQPVNLPMGVIMAVAKALDFSLRTLGFRSRGISARAKKLLVSNFVSSTVIMNSGYSYKYDLDEAFAHWRKQSSNADEWI